VEATLREKEVIARIAEIIETLVGKAAPLHEETEKIENQLIEKDTKAKKAREAEARATFRSEILLECHRAHGKDFITAMKKFYKFADWKITKENHNIGPQTEAILLVFYNIPSFFSRTELKIFLGYKSPNQNVDGALTKMVEKRLLVKTTNKVKTEIYYLGHFAMQLLHRDKVPDVDVRQNQYLESITIRSDNGYRVRNKRQNTARTSSSNKRQELSASKKSSVTPLATKARTDPNPPLSSSNEESSKSRTEPSSKDKEGTLINSKSTSDDESEKSNDQSSSNEESKKSNEESEKSKKSSSSTEREKQAATRTISLHDIMDGMLADTRSV
jgi:hypothetical protein